MIQLTDPATIPETIVSPRRAPLLRLARPHQWAKSVFVLLGPAYAWADPEGKPVPWLAVLGAVVAFSLASSACYIVNDIQDRESDRLHPRKGRRPIASGQVSVPTARAFAGALVVGAALGIVLAIWAGGGREAGLWLAVAVGVYILNTVWYSMSLKHIVILDVISLALGFVLRVLGGVAAAGVTPSSWLLNCVFFLAMFLAFGKRLGERRTVRDAAGVRAVQQAYTDDLLRMAVVVTGVATLITYAGYVQAHGERYTWGFNLLWLTMLPATYALLRCIVLLERGEFDDPTELATADRPFQLAALIFAAVTLVVVGVGRSPAAGGRDSVGQMPDGLVPGTIVPQSGLIEVGESTIIGTLYLARRGWSPAPSAVTFLRSGAAGLEPRSSL
ncbi:MAG: UbiA prenyltransferase family protein [Phycisphaerales bacterium]|nr:UbiA prenyltransferase family protein [Phycisphaerales bacterium]